MQTADIMLALGGNHGHTVPKYGVTAAEIAVLREIHGEASVFDVDPREDVTRSMRDERLRLLEIYGKPPGSRELSAVDVLFPGAAARVFENLDELELDQSFYKATERARPRAKAAKPVAAEAEDAPVGDGVEDEPVEEVDEADEAPAKPPKKKAAPAKTAGAKKSLFK
jgi:hypothetical protein